DRVCHKSGRAHVSECGVDEPKTVRAIKRYGNGLWHPVKVVVQHSQSANIARGTGEPLPTTRKSYDLSVFEPLDGIAQRVVGGGADSSGGQMLLQPDPNAVVGVDANHLARSVEFVDRMQRGIRANERALLHEHVSIRIEHEPGALGIWCDEANVGGPASDRLDHRGAAARRAV